MFPVYSCSSCDVRSTERGGVAKHVRRCRREGTIVSMRGSLTEVSPETVRGFACSSCGYVTTHAHRTAAHSCGGDRFDDVTIYVHSAKPSVQDERPPFRMYRCATCGSMSTANHRMTAHARATGHTIETVHACLTSQPPGRRPTCPVYVCCDYVSTHKYLIRKHQRATNCGNECVVHAATVVRVDGPDRVAGDVDDVTAVHPRFLHPAFPAYPPEPADETDPARRTVALPDEFKMHACSSCGKASTTRCKIERHVRGKTCRDAEIATTTVSFSDSGPYTVYTCCGYVTTDLDMMRRHQKTAGCARPYHIKTASAATANVVERALFGKVPSGLDDDDEDTAALDERIDHLCSSTILLQKCFWDNRQRRHPVATCARIFRHLWGDLAPPAYRAFVHRNKVLHELIREGHVVRYGLNDLRPGPVRNVFIAIVEVAHAVAGRREDFADAALFFLQRLHRTPPLQTRDVIERNENYETHRRKYGSHVQFANHLVRTLKRCFELCKP